MSERESIVPLYGIIVRYHCIPYGIVVCVSDTDAKIPRHCILQIEPKLFLRMAAALTLISPAPFPYRVLVSRFSPLPKSDSDYRREASLFSRDSDMRHSTMPTLSQPIT
jgi:hypothetical protein